jgi:uncharacterized repeat protein (TIGR01451 family)
MKMLKAILAVVFLASAIFLPGSGIDFYVKAYVGWAGAGGSPYVGSNATQPMDINVSRNSGMSWWSSLALDSSGNPHIAWFYDSYGNGDILYINLAPIDRTFNFCVEIEEPFDCLNDPITNTAYFDHAFAQTTLLSNTVTNYLKECQEGPEPDKPVLEITKTSESSHYIKDDTITFNIRVANIGDSQATDVVLKDVFPHELEFLSSRPSGNQGNNSWTKSLGTLTPGQSRRYKLNFRLSGDVHIGENPITIVNSAYASCSELDSVSDTASIVVRNATGVTPLSIFTSWKGIDTKTSIGSAGDEIALHITPSGGSSPYEIVVDWGDGSKDIISDINTENIPAISKHTYNSAGDYNVEIKLTDRYAKTIYVRRTLHIE